MSTGPIVTTGALPASWNILGTPIAPLRRREAIGLLAALTAEQRFTNVGFLNAHSANIAWRDSEFAEVLRTFLVLPDGIGIDLAARLIHRSRLPANLNGTDFVPAFLRALTAPVRVGLLGATRKNVEKAAVELARLAPQHEIAVIHDGFFDAEDEPAILERVAAMRPDILLVAMGVPRQEIFISRKITPRHCTLPIAVGALFDFLSGAVPRAPAWMRRLRLEWLYRLWLEPRRLWRRYILGNPLFLIRVLRYKWGRRSQWSDRGGQGG